jgi:hypothetical protein
MKNGTVQQARRMIEHAKSTKATGLVKVWEKILEQRKAK